MKKNVSNRFALMSAAVLAGAMSFSSCSNDEGGEGVPYGEGPKSEAQMAISFQRFAKDGRGVAGDVNLEGTTPTLLQSIRDLVILPGNGTTYGSAVRMGGLTVATENGTTTVTPDGLTRKGTTGCEYYTNKTISLAEGTSAVKFFGGDVWDGGVLKSTVEYEGETATDDAPTAQNADKKYFNMPKLYYYGEDKQLQFAKEEYSAVETWTDVAAGGLKVTDEAKSIKVDNINYAVGVLQSTVKMATDAKHLWVEDSYDITKIKDEGGVLTAPAEDVQTPTGNPIQIVGYIINDQQANVNVASGFVAGSTAGSTTVYDKVATPASITTTASAVNYTRLFATPAAQKTVHVTLRCKNTSTYALVSRNVWDDATSSYKIGLIEPNADFYLTATLTIGGNNTSGSAPSVIAQDYTTTANFTIANTFNAYTKDPDVKTIEATVGVEVDLAWKAGYTFDETID